jgi:hypothetical protein
MKRLASIALLSAVLAGALPATAGAQGFFGLSYGQNVSEGDCKALAASVGPKKVWFSRFSGSRPDVWDRGLESAWGVGCFKTQKACKSWLYNTQSNWPRLMNFIRCQQGLPAKY